MKFNTLPLAILAATAFNATTAIAQSPDWNWVEAGYSSVDIDGLEETDLSGYSLTGSRLLGENFFVVGSYSTVGDDFAGASVDLNELSLGVGYRMVMTDTTDFYGTISYENIELETKSYDASESIDENGYKIAIGIRSRVTADIELDGSIGYLDINDESEMTLGLAAYYYFNETFALGANYSKIDEFDTMGVSLRLAF